MWIGGLKLKARLAALIVAAAAPSAVALADEASPDATPPLGLSPSFPQPTAADAVLTAPAYPPAQIEPTPSISRLDLSPPPGLSPNLPPEAPAPALAPPPASVEPNPEPPAIANAAPESPPALAPQAPPSPIASPAPAAIATPEPAPDAAPTPVAQPASPADPLGVAIHAALDRLVEAKPAGRPIGAGDWSAARKAIASVYAERAYAPLWLDGDHFNARARAVLARLARADRDGLDLGGAPAPRADLADVAPPSLAEADLALSAAVVAYAMQASGARIYPRSLSKDVSAKPQVADPGFALKRVAAAADPDAALGDFNPPHPGYLALRDALAALRDEAPQPVAQLGSGPVLKLGMSDPRVPLVRARFGLGAAGDPQALQVYDIKVASAVAAFQRVHGLRASGALTEATASALEGANAHGRREQSIIANMEMWRWTPREMGEMRVEVNVPDFSLKLMNGDSVVHKARVIIGKPDTPTPIFSNSIKYMLFNPAWHVPESIIKKEMAPKFASDPSYFARHGYKVSYVGKQLVVEQPPGEANALGRMLFLFPNEHAVYLHDTPMRSLFTASYRALSHGCVRVEDPARLAEILMGGGAKGWTQRRVQSLLGDKERTFSLPTPVPVHLEYFTEFVDENGTLREREDLYGLTAKVAAVLAAPRRD